MALLVLLSVRVCVGWAYGVCGVGFSSSVPLPLLGLFLCLRFFGVWVPGCGNDYAKKHRARDAPIRFSSK